MLLFNKHQGRGVANAVCAAVGVAQLAQAALPAVTLANELLPQIDNLQDIYALARRVLGPSVRVTFITDVKSEADTARSIIRRMLCGDAKNCDKTRRIADLSAQFENERLFSVYASDGTCLIHLEGFPNRAHENFQKFLPQGEVASGFFDTSSPSRKNASIVFYIVHELAHCRDTNAKLRTQPAREEEADKFAGRFLLNAEKSPEMQREIVGQMEEQISLRGRMGGVEGEYSLTAAALRGVLKMENVGR